MKKISDSLYKKIIEYARKNNYSESLINSLESVHKFISRKVTEEEKQIIEDKLEETKEGKNWKVAAVFSTDVNNYSYLVNDEEFISFWKDFFYKNRDVLKDKKGNNIVGFCPHCGKKGVLNRVMAKLKFGSLLNVDKSATFKSNNDDTLKFLGRKQGKNSPVCVECSDKMQLVMEDIILNKKGIIAPITKGNSVFFLRQNDNDDFLGQIIDNHTHKLNELKQISNNEIKWTKGKCSLIKISLGGARVRVIFEEILKEDSSVIAKNINNFYRDMGDDIYEKLSDKIPNSLQLLNILYNVNFDKDSKNKKEKKIIFPAYEMEMFIKTIINGYEYNEDNEVVIPINRIFSKKLADSWENNPENVLVNVNDKFYKHEKYVALCRLILTRTVLEGKKIMESGEIVEKSCKMAENLGRAFTTMARAFGKYHEKKDNIIWYEGRRLYLSRNIKSALRSPKIFFCGSETLSNFIVHCKEAQSGSFIEKRFCEIVNDMESDCGKDFPSCFSNEQRISFMYGIANEEKKQTEEARDRKEEETKEVSE
jgi:hypothetical protein